MAPIICNILWAQKEGTQICTSKTKSLEVPVKGAPPPRSPNRVPMETDAPSPVNGLFIHLYLSESPNRSPPAKRGKNIQSPSVEPHVDGRPIYNGMRPGSPRKRYLSVFKFCKDINLICIGIPKKQYTLKYF